MLVVLAMILVPLLKVLASEANGVSETKVSSPWDYELSEEEIEQLTRERTPEEIETNKREASYVPEEILRLPTKELLKCFLESPAAYACGLASTPAYVSRVDYNSMAFDELLTREDLAKVVAEYGKELQSREKTEEVETAMGLFNGFIVNKDVAPVLNSADAQGESDQQTRAEAASPFYINGIRYDRTGTTYTVSDEPVGLYTAIRNLSQSEINSMNVYMGGMHEDAVLVSNPDSKYNCFSCRSSQRVKNFF